MVSLKILQTGYYTQVKLMLPVQAPLTQRPSATTHQLPTISRRSSPQEEEEQRTNTPTQQPPTVSTRSSPNKVQPLMIYLQQAHTPLFKMLGKRPKKLDKPQVKPTYQKKKTQSYHQHVPVTNESNSPNSPS